MGDSEIWWADDFLVTQKLVRDLATREGTGTIPGRKGDNADLPGQHGVSWRMKPFGAAAVTLTLWFGDDIGVDRAAVEALFADIVRALTPTHRLVRLQRTFGGSNPSTREAWAYLNDQVEPTFDGQYFMSAALALTIPSGFWQATADASIATVAGAALPQTLTFTGVFATASAPMGRLQYRIDGPVSNPVLEPLDDLTGAPIEQLTYQSTLAAGQWVIFDANAWTVTGGGGHTAQPGAVRYSGARFLTSYPARPGAAPRVRLSGGNGGTGTRLTITGRPMWIAR